MKWHDPYLLRWVSCSDDQLTRQSKCFHIGQRLVLLVHHSCDLAIFHLVLKLSTRLVSLWLINNCVWSMIQQGKFVGLRVRHTIILPPACSLALFHVCHIVFWHFWALDVFCSAEFQAVTLPQRQILWWSVSSKRVFQRGGELSAVVMPILSN